MVVVRITYIYLYKKFRNKTKETKPCKDVSACLCLFNRLIYMHGGYREFFKTWITITQNVQYPSGRCIGGKFNCQPNPGSRRA